jgi:hypothetical protein
MCRRLRPVSVAFALLIFILVDFERQNSTSKESLIAVKLKMMGMIEPVH